MEMDVLQKGMELEILSPFQQNISHTEAVLR